MKTIAFFLGAGCSFPSGQPSVHQLTGDMLSRELYLIEALDELSCFQYSLEGSYPRWGTKADLGPDAAKKSKKDLLPWRRPASSIQSFLSDLASLPSWPKKPPDYEDLCGVLRLCVATLFRDLNDPLVYHFLQSNDLISRVEQLDFPPSHRFHSYPLHEKLLVVEDFVGWVVAKRIRVRPKLVGYDPLAKAIDGLRKDGHAVHIVTTNYDCNLERVLRSIGAPFHDGILGKRARDSEERAWRLGGGELSFFNDSSIALVKLHGSINWYMCHDVNASGTGMMAAATTRLGPEQGYKAYISHSWWTFTSKSCPAMLRGSLSKAAEYSYSTYSQLLAAFEQVLQRADVMVVAGFGWSDEAIAARLMRYAYTESKTLLVLDGSRPDPEIARVVEFDKRNLGNVGEGKSITLHRSHLSSLEPYELLAMVRDIIAI
jgi:NAD-dependent SIR2 family protein deacetylase